MSEAWCNSDATSDRGVAQVQGDKGTRSSGPLDFKINSSNSSAPSLRPPKLNEAQLLAAIELGFCGKYLPSSVTGVEGSNPIPDRSGSNRLGQSASMISNTSYSNTGSNQVSGSQNQYPLFVDNYSFNLTEQQQEGLLPPLRRPDINQLPPDVLAVLLKSSRFEEILIPNQRRLTDFPPPNYSGHFANSHNQRTSTTEPDNSVKPTELPPTANNNPPQQSHDGAQASAQVKTGLSPFAKEFVPSTSFQAKSTMNSQQGTSNLTYAMSQVQVQGQNESFQGLVEELDGSDCILSTVTDMISQVSKDPASFNRCAKVTVDVLKKYLNDEDCLGIVVTLVCEQMISNSNFCYSGAKILEILRENEIKVGESDIRKLVLTRTHEEFTNCIEHLDDMDIRMRSHGVLRLLSELYMNFAWLPDNSKLYIIGLAVLELMEKLIQTDKSVDTIKSVCQLLKLIGWEVEYCNSEPVREYFNKVLKELKSLKSGSEEPLHPTSAAMVDMIIKLQGNKWNREQEDPPPSTAPEPQSLRHPVYYELPDSDDDYYDDDTGIMIDDEPDDVQAAYEEFLKMQNGK